MPLFPEHPTFVGMRYFLQLSYNGAAYSGWQSQPNSTGIQAVIEDNMQTLLRERVEILGCGRTDAGVHAAGFYAHFDWPGELPEYFFIRLNPLSKILRDIIIIMRFKEKMDSFVQKKL